MDSTTSSAAPTTVTETTATSASEAASAPAAPVITLTDSAAARIRSLVTGKPDTAGLRLAVRGGGCSGLQLHMELCDVPKPKDKVFENQGGRIFVDGRSFLYLQGSSLDYFQTLMQSGFRLHNPNKKTECGCGESFSV